MENYAIRRDSLSYSSIIKFIHCCCGAIYIRYSVLSKQVKRSELNSIYIHILDNDIISWLIWVLLILWSQNLISEIHLYNCNCKKLLQVSTRIHCRKIFTETTCTFLKKVASKFYFIVWLLGLKKTRATKCTLTCCIIYVENTLQ